MSGCERNLAGREEDIGMRVTYVPCGAPATCTVDADTDHEWRACTKHGDEAELDGCEVTR